MKFGVLTTTIVKRDRPAHFPRIYVPGYNSCKYPIDFHYLLDPPNIHEQFNTDLSCFFHGVRIKNYLRAAIAPR